MRILATAVLLVLTLVERRTLNHASATRARTTSSDASKLAACLVCQSLDAFVAVARSTSIATV